MRVLIMGQKDIWDALKNINGISMLAYEDVQARFERSRVGPFWVAVNTGLIILMLGYVYRGLFNQEVTEFLPYLSVGYVVWIFISTTLIEACDTYVTNRENILHYKIPLATYVLRLVVKNIIVLMYNCIPVIGVFLYFEKSIDYVSLQSLLMFLVLILNITAVSIILALSCARYRDINIIIQNALLILFYITPIMWSIEFIPKGVDMAAIYLNPMLYMIAGVRDPILGQIVAADVVCMTMIFSIFLALCSISIHGRYAHRVAYWI